MDSRHRRADRSDYDAIIVGSGLGGLSAAALLAKAGRRTLVLEQHDRPGGYCHSFQRRGFVFDAAVQLVAGGGGRGILGYLLDRLGISGLCEFIPAKELYVALFPGLRMEIPGGKEPFRDRFAALFPGSAPGLSRLLDLCSGVYAEVRRWEEGAPFDETRVRRLPLLARYRGATLEEAARGLVEDPKARAAFAVLWPFLGLPPSRLSFVYWSMMLMSYLEEGAFYCRGSFQKLADAFAAAHEAAGGELVLRRRVSRILVRGGRAAGVELEGGETISAPVVVSNSDALQTYAELVGEESLPSGFLPRLRAMKPSISAFCIYAATDLDVARVGGSHKMFFSSTWDHDEQYRSILAAEPVDLQVTIPTLMDPSLAPPGKHVLILIRQVPYEGPRPWSDEKAGFSERMVARLERDMPELKGRLLFAEGGTPQTMVRYTLNSAGSLYGWEPSPAQVLEGRLGRETPVPGLYLSGHWTRPGGGVNGVVTSGLLTASAVLGYPSPSDLLRDLAGASLPGRR